MLTQIITGNALNFIGINSLVKTTAISTNNILFRYLSTTKRSVKDKKLTLNQLKKQKLKENGPKRPSSAYFKYFMSIRDDLVRENPNAKVTEIAALGAKKWNTLNDFEKQSLRDKFTRELREYQVAKGRFIKQNLPPKKPLPPYVRFTQEIRDSIVRENPNLTFGEISQVISNKWSNLNNTEKEKYVNQYRHNLQDWNSKYLKFN
ncbi:hypothetical protein KAFR_0A01880 [Kazachstania africana CBS 2517]|uniref:HMG box domain-containing protein n=1 Tax=Kazachstania africana (strain ATCC 22294 / BCRC 22015 / CBS 2517 / CECT 1963 / NBRC 1671 / NRRL Y-8276) TaxID=1071382 RepID=H2AMM6_KAZAF|nr:hypothetical protein KAFR_0A01880 [Kazachstania africana CBS 2517]CCF55626.1 hypothetical protein KAFR_0A01880 [Kazachstania africana CBS 2517]